LREVLHEAARKAELVEKSKTSFYRVNKFVVFLSIVSLFCVLTESFQL
jgi:hypothetical protein